MGADFQEAGSRSSLQAGLTNDRALGALGRRQRKLNSHFTFWQRKRETLKTTKYVELVIVADNREVRALGRSSGELLSKRELLSWKSLAGTSFWEHCGVPRRGRSHGEPWQSPRVQGGPTPGVSRSHSVES